jgi:hypothetical protein
VIDMSKREPVAEIAAGEYRIVRHTHDVELASRLMRAKLLSDYGCPGDGTADGFCPPDHTDDDCPHDPHVGTPRREWMRIVHCLPGSFGDGEGWSFEYQNAEPGTRGAFRAVVFS